MAEPPLHLRRAGRVVLLACTPELAEYAERLGRVADALAAEDPLPPPLRVFQRLYEVAQPEFPPELPAADNERLSAWPPPPATAAAVSSRQELYPRGMAAARALQLGLGALTGLEVGDLDARASGSTPEHPRPDRRAATPRPSRCPTGPSSTPCCTRPASMSTWDDEKTIYRRPDAVAARHVGLVAAADRRITARRTGRRAGRRSTPEVAEARQFEERLRHALRDGGFLVLTVRPSRMHRLRGRAAAAVPGAGAGLVRRPAAEALRAEAAELEVDWQVVEQADGAPTGSAGLARTCAPGRAGRSRPSRPSSCVARSTSCWFIRACSPATIRWRCWRRLRDQVGHEGPCPGLWVLVAADGQSELPMLDGREVPLITPGQRAQGARGLGDETPASRRRHGGQTADEARPRSTPRRLLPTCKRLVQDLKADLLERSARGAPRSTPGCARRYQAIDERRPHGAGVRGLAGRLPRPGGGGLGAGLRLRPLPGGQRPHRRDATWPGDGRPPPPGRGRARALLPRRTRTTPTATTCSTSSARSARSRRPRDLFAEGKTPLWAVGPSGDAATKLLAFWREIDPETGAPAAVASRSRRATPGSWATSTRTSPRRPARSTPCCRRRVRRGVHPRPHADAGARRVRPRGGPADRPDLRLGPLPARGVPAAVRLWTRARAGDRADRAGPAGARRGVRAWTSTRSRWRSPASG